MTCDFAPGQFEGAMANIKIASDRNIPNEMMGIKDMTFSKEAQAIILAAVRAKTAGGATEAQRNLAQAVTHGEANMEVLCGLIDDVRQS